MQRAELQEIQLVDGAFVRKGMTQLELGLSSGS